MVNYIHLDSVGSTNSWVKAYAHTFDPEKLTCVTAAEQTAGRGRFNRTWLSPRGENIYATFFITLEKSFPYLTNLGQLLALSCALTLEEKGFPVQIKWPNDLLIEEKKVGGILCEIIDLGDFFGAATGIGINVDMGEALLQTLDQPAVSLTQLSPDIWKAEQILEPLTQKFLQNLAILKESGFARFQKKYNSFLYRLNEKISCQDGLSLREGTCQGVSSDGFLQIALPSGEIALISSGELKFI